MTAPHSVALWDLLSVADQYQQARVVMDDVTARREAAIVAALTAGAGSHAVAKAAGLSPARVRAIARHAGLTGQTWTTKGDTT